MDAISDRYVQGIVVMSSAQVGKTELLLNAIGYHVDLDPCPMLILQPSEKPMAEAFSKDRLAPMVRDTPALRGKIADAKSRSSGNTVLHKSFPGGHITIAGAQSPKQLASRPIRKVFLDEVDRYEASAGTEGDPTLLAIKRTTTFWNRQWIATSTPTVKGQSRIEKAYQASDRRQFWVPCPHCGSEQVLDWSNVWWPKDEEAEGDDRHRPEEAGYKCSDCGTIWTDEERWGAVGNGHWVARDPFKGVAGFHLNEIYSPWVRLSDLVQRFLDARRDPEMLKAWTNTALGETWEERGDTVETDGLKRLIMQYDPDSLPNGVQFATAGVDVQDDRLEVEIVGWNWQEESWGIEYHRLYGDPAQFTVWSDLDELLKQSWETDDGRLIRVAAAAVDSGGSHTQSVYQFCGPRFARRIYAIKGDDGPRPIWPLKASQTKARVPLFIVGVDTAKQLVYSRFRIGEPDSQTEGRVDGPGFCHLPPLNHADIGYDDEWTVQAVAEERREGKRQGRTYKFWWLPKGKRNEALDCRVYATAAMKSLPRPAAAKRNKPKGRRPGRRSSFMEARNG